MTDAQEQCDELIMAAEEACDSGDLTTAHDRITQAMAIASSFALDRSSAAMVARYVAGELVANDEPGQALEIATRALALEEPPDYGLLAILAEANRALGSSAEAEQLARKALQGAEAALAGATEGAEILSISCDVSDLHQSLGAPQQAVSALRAALEAAPPEWSLEADECRRELAILLTEGGQAQEGEALFREVLASTERWLGLDHPALAAPLRNLAIALRAQGRLDEAAELEARASTLAEARSEP